MNIETYILPSYWASALINGDFSGLEDSEEKRINNFIEKESRNKPCFYCVGCSDESYFSHGHDENRNEGSDVLEYNFVTSR